MHSDGPASQGEQDPAHLQELIKICQQLQPAPSDHNLGKKQKSTAVQNREVAETIIGLQQSLLGKEDGVKFATQKSNKDLGKNIVQ